jgi:hypothetical protein
MPGGGLSVKKHPVGVFSEEPEFRCGSEGARLPRWAILLFLFIHLGQHKKE